MKPKTAIFFLERPIGLYVGAVYCMLMALVCGTAIADAFYKSSASSEHLLANKWVVLFICGFAFSILSLGAFNFLGRACFTRLVISPEEIQYHTLGYSISAAWDDVKSVQRNKKYKFGMGLNLDNAIVIARNPKFLFKPHSPYDQYIGLLEFNSNWEQGEIGSLLRHHAPRLFEPQETKSQAYKEE
jgi:hypothetical protein